MGDKTQVYYSQSLCDWLKRSDHASDCFPNKLEFSVVYFQDEIMKRNFFIETVIYYILMYKSSDDICFNSMNLIYIICIIKLGPLNINM